MVLGGWIKVWGPIIVPLFEINPKSYCMALRSGFYWILFIKRICLVNYWNVVGFDKFILAQEAIWPSISDLVNRESSK